MSYISPLCSLYLHPNPLFVTFKPATDLFFLNVRNVYLWILSCISIILTLMDDKQVRWEITKSTVVNFSTLLLYLSHFQTPLYCFSKELVINQVILFLCCGDFCGDNALQHGCSLSVLSKQPSALQLPEHCSQSDTVISSTPLLH